MSRTEATLRRGGQRMITVQARFHLGLEELAYYAHVFTLLKDRSPKGRGELIDWARSQLAIGDYPHCGVWDDITEAEIALAEAAVLTLFPEMGRTTPEA